MISHSNHADFMFYFFQMSSLPRKAKIKVQTAIYKDEFSSFSELSSASEEDDKEDSAWEPQKKVPRIPKQPICKDSKPKRVPRVKKNTLQISDGSEGAVVKVLVGALAGYRDTAMLS